MKAALVTTLGSAEAPQLQDVPTPTCTDDTVLVAVAAAGLNPIDVKSLAGAGVYTPEHSLRARERPQAEGE